MENRSTYQALATTKRDMELLIAESSNLNATFHVNDSSYMFNSNAYNQDTDAFVDEDLLDDLFEIAGVTLHTGAPKHVDDMELFTQLLADAAQHQSVMAMQQSNSLAASAAATSNTMTEPLFLPAGGNSMMMTNNNTYTPSMKSLSTSSFMHQPHQGNFLQQAQQQNSYFQQLPVQQQHHLQLFDGNVQQPFTFLNRDTHATACFNQVDSSSGFSRQQQQIQEQQIYSSQEQQLLLAALLSNPATARAFWNQINSASVSSPATAVSTLDGCFGLVSPASINNNTALLPATASTTAARKPTSAKAISPSGMGIVVARVKPKSVMPTPASPLTPLRALSAYNFFFRDERERILNESSCDDNDFSIQRQELLLQAHWNRDRTVKRRHRKSHGKISFSTLSKRISQRWKELSEAQKSFFGEIAAKDWERYHRELTQQKADCLT